VLLSARACVSNCRRPGQTDSCAPRNQRCRSGGGRLKQDLDTDFLNNLGLHTCCTEIILHCVSVSNQLRQWTNFCTNFSSKSWREWGTRSPVEKSGGRRLPRPRPHYTPARNQHHGGSFPPYGWTSKNFVICVCFHCHGTSSYHTTNTLQGRRAKSHVDTETIQPGLGDFVL